MVFQGHCIENTYNQTRKKNAIYLSKLINYQIDGNYCLMVFQFSRFIVCPYQHRLLFVNLFLFSLLNSKFQLLF